ncbi:hypothetical protein V6N13_076507 [Hibiscus sabdariffa]|uniref:Uncharacterized protein n=2 Tax=Hibiscus sabdariffa TaxID=183260 RepID=A0ABR2AGJ3_9ROSI
MYRVTSTNLIAVSAVRKDQSKPSISLFSCLGDSDESPERPCCLIIRTVSTVIVSPNRNYQQTLEFSLTNTDSSIFMPPDVVHYSTTTRFSQDLSRPSSLSTTHFRSSSILFYGEIRLFSLKRRNSDEGSRHKVFKEEDKDGGRDAFQIASAAQRPWRCFSFEEIFFAINAFSSVNHVVLLPSKQRRVHLRRVAKVPIVAAVSENLIKVEPDQNDQSVEFMVRAVVTVRNKNMEDFKETLMKH